MLRKLLILIIILASLAVTVQAQDDNCTLPPRLQVDRQAQVIVGSGSNRIRLEPSTQSDHLGDIPEGGVFTVVAGPYCGEGYIWWLVDYEHIQGWTVEGSDSVYWLEPIAPPTPSGAVPTPAAPLALSPNAITAANAAQVTQQARFGNGWISDVEWSADGNFMAVSTSLGVRLYDIANPNSLPRELLDHEAYTHDIAFSPDSNLLAATGNDHTVYVWDIPAGTLHYTLPHQHPVVKVDFSPNGVWLVTSEAGEYDSNENYQAGEISLWDVPSGTIYKTASSEKISEKLNGNGFERIQRFLFSADKAHLFMADYYDVLDWDIAQDTYRVIIGSPPADWAMNSDFSQVASVPQDFGDEPIYQSLMIYDLNQKAYVAQRNNLLARDNLMVSGVYFTPSDDLLITTGVSDPLSVRDPQSLDILTNLTDNVSTVAFSPDGALMATGSIDGGVRLFTTPVLNSEGEVYSQSQNALYGMGQRITKVLFSPDGTKIAATGADNRVLVWDVATGDRVAAYRDFNRPFNIVVFSDDGKSITGAEESAITVWDRKTRQTVFTSRNFEGRVQYLAVSPDSSMMAFNTDIVKEGFQRQNRLYLWNGRTGDTIGTLDQMPGSLCFRQDGTLVLSATLQQVTPENGQLTASPLENFDPYSAHSVSAISGSRQLFAFTYSRTPMVEITDANTGKLFQTVKLDGSWWIHDLALSQNGHFVAAYYDNDNTYLQAGIIIWDTTTGKTILQLDEGSNGALDMTLSPDGSIVATSYPDGTIRLWDVEGNKELARLRSHVGVVNDIAFSQDGAWLVSASGDGTIRLWGIE